MALDTVNIDKILERQEQTKSSISIDSSKKSGHKSGCKFLNKIRKKAKISRNQSN